MWFIPNVIEGFPDLPQIVRIIIPQEFWEMFLPNIYFFSYRCWERGFGGLPVLMPSTVWLYPHRLTPVFYMTFTLDTGTFMLGAITSVYIGYSNNFICPGMETLTFKYMFLDVDGFELGGTWRDRLNWLWKDKVKFWIMFWTTCPYFFGGGLLHSFNYACYRCIVSAHSNMIPMVVTYIVLAMGDGQFMYQFRTMGKAVYGALLFDFLRHCFCSGNSGLFQVYYMAKFFVKPLRALFSVKNWIEWVTPVAQGMRFYLPKGSVPKPEGYGN